MGANDTEHLYPSAASAGKAAGSGFSGPLPPTVQQRFEAAFGADLSAVTVHVNHAATLMGAGRVYRRKRHFFRPSLVQSFLQCRPADTRPRAGSRRPAERTSGHRGGRGTGRGRRITEQFPKSQKAASRKTERRLSVSPNPRRQPRNPLNFAELVAYCGKIAFKLPAPNCFDAASANTSRKSVVTARSRPSFNWSDFNPFQSP